MSYISYGGQVDVESVAYGRLAVIVPILERMNVKAIIDQHLPADAQAEFGNGTILSLLIAARLYAPVALKNVSEWAASSGAEAVFGIPTEKMTDDRLGRSLGRFFSQRHSILSSIALHVSKEFNVPLREVHYDPSHIQFTGAYENAVPRNGVVDQKQGNVGAVSRGGSHHERARDGGHAQRGEDDPRGIVCASRRIWSAADLWSYR